MKIRELMKEFIMNNEKIISLFQQAVIESLSSLIYSEYIRNIKQQQVPIVITWVPKIRLVYELLEHNSHLMELLSESLIDSMIEKSLFQSFKGIPELEIFKDENNNLELLKTTLDFYILPNAYKVIPYTISKKFDLNNPDQQAFRESKDLDLFERIPITDKQFDYIVTETIISLFLKLDSINKRIDYPSDNTEVFLVEGEILTINHANAICPIHINEDIINNEEVMPLLSFVTNTVINEHDYHGSYMIKNDSTVFHDVKSNPFNKLTTTEFLDL